MPTAADRVFRQLVSEILTGALRPRDQVSERDLVDKYGVSRTPAREAVKRLMERGFLERGPKKGTPQVVELDRDDLVKLYDLRLMLESYAADEIVKSIDNTTIFELRRLNGRLGAAIEKRDLGVLLDVRSQFHEVLVKSMNNRWLSDILISLRQKAYVVRYTHWQDIEIAKEVTEIHDKIIRALERKNVEQYRKHVLGQIQSSLDLYLSLLQPKRFHGAPSD